MSKELLHCPADGTSNDASGEVLAVKRSLGPRMSKVVFVVAVVASLFHLWVNTFGLMPEIQRNALHFSFICFLGFIQFPMMRRHSRETLPLDLFLGVLVFIVGLYLLFFEDALHARNEVPIVRDLLFAGVAVLLMLEVTRRATGLLIPVLSLLFLGYALFLGRMFHGLWHFPGVTMERMLYRMYFAPDGLFGTIATISSTYVFLFVLFAAFLLKSGAGDFIIRLAMALMGRTVGGPAKMAVFASGLMGSVSGSAVANTVGTGSITIPMMKRIGFSPRFAGAVEAAASTGGQLMPPIMGAGAFIMSEWTQIPYLKIVAVSIIPALMYFLSVAFFVHLRARKMGIQPLPEDEIPKLREVLKGGWNFSIPLLVLVGFLMKGYTPTFAACAGIVSIVVASWLNPKTRMGLGDILDALATGAVNMVSTGVILLCSGIIIGVVLMVGMGIKFSMLISGWSTSLSLLLHLQSVPGGEMLVAMFLVASASLILGMGLPVTASYIVLAILAANALTNLGASLLAAHMLIFWYSQDANVTPPICLAAYTAAGIAGSKPLETGLESWKLAKGLYLIPILFIFTPLLFDGPLWKTFEAAITGTLGLFSFAIFFEGFHLVRLGWGPRLVYALLALMLFLPSTETNIAGAVLLVGMLLYERSRLKRDEPVLAS